MLSRFHRILQRDGRMDRQTERIAISISRVSMLTRQKNVAAEASDFHAAVIGTNDDCLIDLQLYLMKLSLR